MPFVALPLGFLVNPALLALGAGLVAVPIIIHLLNRRRVRRVEWAAMDWLLAAVKRHQRRLRLENWLILMLRCLALLLLGLALARPVLTDSALAGLFGEKRSVYVVLDTSFSTSAKTDARSVFERVKHETEQVLSSLGKKDSVAIIVTNNPDEDNYDGIMPSVLVPRTVGGESIARAKESVAAIQPRDGVARWTDTLEVLQEQMQTEDVNRQVVIITDLQAKDWLEAPTDGSAGSGRVRLSQQLVEILRQGARVQVLDVGGAERRNLAVTSIRSRTERGTFVDRPVSLEIEVENFGADPVQGAVLEVAVDGQKAKATPVPTIDGADTGTLVPQPGRVTVTVDVDKQRFTEPGSHEIAVRIGAPSGDAGSDNLGLDSERWFVISTRRRIEVLAYTRDTERPGGRKTSFELPASRFLRGIYEGDQAGDETAALGVSSLYGFEAVANRDHLGLRLRDRRKHPVDLVVLCNTPLRDPNLIATLREFVRDGGALMVFSGDRFSVPSAFGEDFHGDDVDDRLAPYATEPAETRPPDQTPFGFDLSEQEHPHPLAVPFTGPMADLWLRRQPPKIWGRTPFVEPPLASGPGGEGPGDEQPAGQVVLRFEKVPGERVGKPAVIAGEFGEGRTLWIGTSIDNGWMERAAFPFLPVFLEEAALWLTEPRGSGRNIGVGDPIQIGLPAGAEEPRFMVPGGMQMSPTRRVDDPAGSGRSVVSYDTVGVSGIWKLTYQMPQPSGESKRVVEMISVNVDANEGSLLPADPGAITADVPPELPLTFHQGYDETREKLEEVREGETTRYVLWGLLAILLIESFLAMRFGRRGQTAEAD